ncbi:MAG: DUF2510 domain-containing protein [Pseudolysinimonas sp.]
MTDPTHATPPGWYPDQNAPGQQRWWDGTQWTDRVQAAYSTAHHYAALKAPAGTTTGTIWIWLYVLSPVLGLISLFAIDIAGYMRSVLANPGSVSGTLSLYTSPGFILATIGGWLLVALGIVFAFLDWRALKARGVPQPFHWAFAFFGVAGYGLVYAIGRSVVAYRRTGAGLAPLWATIAVYVVSFIVALIWSFSLMQTMMTLIPQTAY